MGEDIEQQAALLPEEEQAGRLHRAAVAADRARLGNVNRACDRRLGSRQPGLRRERRDAACRRAPRQPTPARARSLSKNEGQSQRDRQRKRRATGDFVPRLSADGYTVAFVSQAPLVAAGEDFGAPRTARQSDLYVANMHPGLTRDQALTPVTELAGGEGARPADTAPISDFDISPDGDQVAFTTRRTELPAGLPRVRQHPRRRTGDERTVSTPISATARSRASLTATKAAKPANTPHRDQCPPAKTPTKRNRATARSRPPSPTTATCSRSPRPPPTSSSATATRPRRNCRRPALRRQRRVRGRHADLQPAAHAATKPRPRPNRRSSRRGARRDRALARERERAALRAGARGGDAARRRARRGRGRVRSARLASR